MTNIALSLAVLRACAAAGVRELVLCAGARNAPLVSVLAKAWNVRTYSFFEERSAAFFALGRMQASGRPVAVITTSGTAVAELLPATIEADHQGLPLILITADRPRRYRGSGAPQAIVQPGIFSHYVGQTLDIEVGWTPQALRPGARPLHLNVGFDEPLLDEPISEWDWPAVDVPRAVLTTTVSAVKIEATRPLVLIGGLMPSQTSRVYETVRAWGRPVYAEATSQLRGRFDQLEVRERSLPDLDYDGVIRIGSVPTVRLWRDLERSTKPVWHFSHLPYSGLPRTPVVHPLEALTAFSFVKWDQRESRNQLLGDLIARFPLSEPAWVNWISRQIPRQGGRVFLGNSLPIREWDLAAQPGSYEVFANRGVNGIDGQLSTFLGAAEETRANWGVFGDLTALYDLSAPWALGQRPLRHVNFALINNGGGKIFQRLFRNPAFENRHDLRFKDWANMWSLAYTSLTEPAALAPVEGPRVLEILPSAEQTDAFWREWEATT